MFDPWGGGKTYFYIGNGQTYEHERPKCVFLAGFDQPMPADEKKESLYIKPEHIRAIFNLAGIVMPALLPDGQVVGKRKKKNKKVSVTLFGEIHTKQKSLIAESAGSLWDDIASIGFTR